MPKHFFTLRLANFNFKFTQKLILHKINSDIRGSETCFPGDFFCFTGAAATLLTLVSIRNFDSDTPEQWKSGVTDQNKLNSKFIEKDDT